MRYGKNRILWFKFKESIALKDIMIILGWIFGLVIIASLCWFFTQPMRNRLLINAVNQVLERSGDYRRVSEPVPVRYTRTLGLGRWYYFSEDTRIYIFTFIGEGTFFPCAAVKTAEGKVEEFIPLNHHGERILKRISPEIVEMYSKRIYAQRIEKDRS